MSYIKKELPSIDSRPLTYAHKIPILKTQKFWEGLKKGEIYAVKCVRCEKLYFPPQTDCPICLASEVEWIKLNKTVVLETFTQVHVKPQGFTQYEPYTIAIAKTKEGVKVMGWLENIKLEEIKIGMKLEMNVKTLQDGYITITFKPVPLG